MFDRTHRGLRVLLAALVVAVAAVLVPSSVSAHTDLESTTPADGEVVGAPVGEIVITFTSAASEAGDGFQVLDASGQVRTPSQIVVEQDRIFRLAFEPRLAGGVIGVRWSVRAGDAHPISGSFSFTVDAPASPASTAPPVTSTTTPPTTDASSPVDDGAGNELDGAATDASVPTDPVAPDAATDTATDATGDTTVEPPSETVAATAADPAPPEDASTVLADFLDVDDEPDGAGLARTGRIVGFAGVVFGLGALAFAATVFVGERREVTAVLRAAQVLAGLIAVGAVIEYVGVASLLDESLTGAWSTEAGLATVLRGVGGVAIVVGLWALPGVRSVRRRPAAVALSAGVLSPDSAQKLTRDERRARWRPDRSAWPVAAGAVAVIASFWFDGHTVTKGFRPLHALVNSIHVAAAAVWAGGVAALAVVAWVRYRAGRPRRFGELVVRFSSIATVALVAVAAAGVLMTFMILDSFDELTGTPWGELMLLKLAAVTIAALFGAYNHLRLRPALENDPDDPNLLVVVRNTLTAEAIVLAFVVVVTAWLVVAAS